MENQPVNILKFMLVPALLVLNFIHMAAAEQLTLSGRVRHAHTFQEIPYVNIYIQDHPIGTSSEIDGRFSLLIPDFDSTATLVFEHVAFDTLTLSLGEAVDQNNYYMIPRLIQSSLIMVQAPREMPRILRDIPQPYSIIQAKNFDVQGYVDAGDLLRNEQSIQVEEELSGKKTIAIRGGNADDVIILYHGIKMNSAYDNAFDLSLINLEDVRHVEIIRGSHTSLYAAEAFSGVVNIVPKMYRNYHVRFQQRLGTYASGDWSLQFNHTFKNRLNASYSYKQGSTKRRYYDAESTADLFLNNRISNHSAQLLYDLSDGQSESEKYINVLYLRSTLDHENDKYDETLNNLNQMLITNYTGNIWKIGDFGLTAAYHWLNRRQQVNVENGTIEDNYESRNVNVNIDKDVSFKLLEWYGVYQYENGKLLFNNRRDLPNEPNTDLEGAVFRRQKHGLASVLKLHIPTYSEFLKKAQIDLSYRFDRVNNQQDHDPVEWTYLPSDSLFEPTEAQADNQWSESTFKFSTNLSWAHRFLRVQTYLNFGSNVKFPTLFQQISTPFTFGPYARSTQPNLNPEKNHGLELGFHTIREIDDEGTLNGWQVDVNYFRNYYENKFRIYYTPGLPNAFYDNVNNAEISGVEAGMKLFLLRNKISYEMGLSKYFISERLAFPFKSDLKYVINLFIDHAGYSLQLRGFHESEQIAWLRNLRGEYWEIILPGYSNLDFHLNKTFELKGFKFFTNFSARNIFDDDTLLEGIAIRDRRFYITLGAQY